jgi:hypothetical protein
MSESKQTCDVTPTVGQVWACKQDEADPYRYERALVVVLPPGKFARSGCVRIKRLTANRSSEVGMAGFLARYRYVAASVEEWESR